MIPGEKLHSALGMDPGLVTFATAHVERRNPEALVLISGRVYSGRDYPDEPTVAEKNALLVRDLEWWLRPILGQAVLDGAEAFYAERYEHVRQSSAAAKYAAGHAALVCATSRCEPRPRLQVHGSGCPAYVAGRDAKRALTGCDVATKRVMGRAARRVVLGAARALDAMRVIEAAHLADAIGIATYALGHREKPVLLGEMARVAGASFFEGPRGVRMKLLLGGRKPRPKCSICHGRGIATGVDAITANAVENPRAELCLCCAVVEGAIEGSFELRSLLTKSTEPDPRDHGKDFFPMPEATHAAALLEPSLDGRTVIFTSERIAEAFGVEKELGLLEWGEVKSGDVAYMAAVLPFLSAENRWWSKPANVRKAELFLRAAARSA